MDFGLGLGMGTNMGSNRYSQQRNSEWETGFRVESLSMEVSGLVQERRLLWQHLENTQETVRSLAGTVETLAAELEDLRDQQGGSGGKGVRPVVAQSWVGGGCWRTSNERAPH